MYTAMYIGALHFSGNNWEGLFVQARRLNVINQIENLQIDAKRAIKNEKKTDNQNKAENVQTWQS